MTNFTIHYLPETCRLCEGSGKYLPQKNVLQQEICPGCRGQGSKLVAQPARKCALCEGTGLYLPDKNVFTKEICPACKGCGWANTQ